MPPAACPRCAYSFAGLPGPAPTCPECGLAPEYPSSPDPVVRAEQLRIFAAARGLWCRHCQTPLAEMRAGACGGCGTRYDFPDALPARAVVAQTTPPRRVPGWKVVAGFLVIFAIVVALGWMALASL
ncbi:MAG: hypothetical protein AAFX79_06265 [Planctomycetota bacterium]